MKKIFILLLSILLLVTKVYATSGKEISRIEYKWYKEKQIEGTFYPKKDNLSGYYENQDIIEYSNYSEWDSKYCSYSKEYYDVEEKTIIKYEKVVKTKYIRLELIRGIGTYDDFKEIKVFYENKELNYKYFQDDVYGIKLELENEYDTDKLHFFIDIDVRYFIYLENNDGLKIISYSVIPFYYGKKLFPNYEWITPKTLYELKTSEEKIENSEFVKNISEEKMCRAREIKTYRYKIKREYYDNDYHIYVEGYIPDIKNSIIYYKDDSEKNNNSNNQISYTEPPEKIELPQKIDDKLLNNNEKIIYKTEYINKEVKKIPLKIYILLIILIIIIIFETIKIIEKKVD